MSYLRQNFGNGIQDNSELARQHVWFIKARQDQVKREFIADKKEEVTAGLGAEAVIASEFHLREFDIKLDQYEEATTAALMKNQKQLDFVNAQIETMLAQAYVMPDGRRVFKTEEGNQVFDENGIEVSRDELDFDLISEDSPKWEEFQNMDIKLNELSHEREGLLNYQDRLDNARDTVADGEITEEELDALNAVSADVIPRLFAAERN